MTTVTKTRKDYLLGREYFCQENLGNELFKTLINIHSAEYEQAGGARSQVGKRLKEQVVNQVRANGGRFLKRVDARGQLWTEMSREEAMTVVVGGFRNKRRADAADRGTSATGGGSSTMSSADPPMSRVAEDESPATRPNTNDLSFTILFDALNISLQDPGPRSVMQDHIDDSYGVEEFLAIFSQNPENVLRDHGFTKSLHQKRLYGFIVWFETEYKNSATNPSRAVLNRQSWLDFFTAWVRNDCPSVSQLKQQHHRQAMQLHQQRPPMPQYPPQYHVSLPLQQQQVPSMSSGERGTVASVTEDMSLMSMSITPSEASRIIANQPGAHSVIDIMEDSTV